MSINKKITLEKITIGLVITSVLLMPTLALGQADPGLNPQLTLDAAEKTDKVTTLLAGTTRFTTLVSWFIGIFWILAIIFAIIAAIKYLMSQGDPEKTKSAKDMIVYVIVASAVALLGTGIQAIANSVLGD